jgi:hypothetical protein
MSKGWYSQQNKYWGDEPDTWSPVFLTDTGNYRMDISFSTKEKSDKFIVEELLPLAEMLTDDLSD